MKKTLVLKGEGLEKPFLKVIDFETSFEEDTYKSKSCHILGINKLPK